MDQLVVVVTWISQRAEVRGGQLLPGAWLWVL